MILDLDLGIVLNTSSLNVPSSATRSSYETLRGAAFPRVSDSVTGWKRCHSVPAPMTTIIGTVVTYSNTKLVSNFGNLYIKI